MFFDSLLVELYNKQWFTQIKLDDLENSVHSDERETNTDLFDLSLSTSSVFITVQKLIRAF